MNFSGNSRIFELTVLIVTALLFVSALPASAAPVQVQSETGSVFDPEASGTVNLGDASFTSGALLFNTDTAKYSTDGGVTWSAEANYGLSESGDVELGLFVFNSLTIGGITVTVQGNRGLALASRGDMTFQGTLNVNGGSGSGGTYSNPGGDCGTWSTPDLSGKGGFGAPGAEGGNLGADYESAPPPSDAGNGGLRSSDGDGIGYGGGTENGEYGGGGGYGGAGGSAGATGGSTYGDNILLDLYGGSGGGGANRRNSCWWQTWAGGGGGGGAIELVAAGNLAFSGTLNARGGYGKNNGDNRVHAGGGSGGGILMAGTTVNFTGSISVKGGNVSAASDTDGNSGGGGRVAVYTGLYASMWNPGKWSPTNASGLSDEQLSELHGLTYSGGSVDTSCGDRPDGQNGGAGTFYIMAVPPPTGTLISIR